MKKEFLTGGWRQTSAFSVVLGLGTVKSADNIFLWGLILSNILDKSVIWIARAHTGSVTFFEAGAKFNILWNCESDTFLIPSLHHIGSRRASIVTIRHQIDSKNISDFYKIQTGRKSGSDAGDVKEEGGSLTELLIRPQTRHKHKRGAGPAVHSYEVFVIFTCKTRLYFQRCVFFGGGGSGGLFLRVFSVSTFDSSAFVQTLLLFFPWSLMKNVLSKRSTILSFKNIDEAYSSLTGWHFKTGQTGFYRE